MPDEIKNHLPYTAKVEFESLEIRQDYFNRVHAAFAVLREQLQAYKPDALIMIGDDQGDMFDDANNPTFSIYTGPALLLALSLAVLACGSKMDRELQPTPSFTPPPTQAPYPVFEGTINGITFGPHSREPSPAQLSPKCVLGSGGIGNSKTDVWRDESFVVNSPLDFEFTYLPAGARFSYVAASRCEDDVILIQREYNLPDTSFYVVRKKGPAYYVPHVPLQFSYLTPTTIAGRPAVLQEAPMQPAVYVLDEGSSWEVAGLGLQELIKVAEGLRSR